MCCRHLFISARLYKWYWSSFGVHANKHIIDTLLTSWISNARFRWSCGALSELCREKPCPPLEWNTRIDTFTVMDLTIFTRERWRGCTHPSVPSLLSSSAGSITCPSLGAWTAPRWRHLGLKATGCWLSANYVRLLTKNTKLVPS